MGAVKTNRPKDFSFDRFGKPELKYGEIKKLTRDSQHDVYRLLLELKEFDSVNNRRRMSGKPLIRRGICQHSQSRSG